ncbi:Hypothetical predicted protein, partial [Pelobates cultripes]
EVPRFMEELELPPVTVINWILGPMGPPPRPQRMPRRDARSQPGRPPQRHRHPTAPE